MAKRKTTRRRRTLLDDIGEVGGEFGAVAEVIQTPGGIRCKDYRGKFTRCLAGDLGDMGDLGETGATSGAKRRKTKKSSSKREYIPKVGYRCRYTSGKKKGKFKKC